MITSSKNKLIKEVKLLHNAQKRKKAQKYLLEGEHLVLEALQSNLQPEIIFCTENYLEQTTLSLRNQKIELVTEEVLKAISQTQTPQGIIAIMPLNKVEFSITQLEGPILALDQVQDPGNLGTIIRTADAAGYTAVLLNHGTVDIYNDKVLRAMQGSQYHLPIYYTDLATTLTELKTKDYELYATALDCTAKSYTDIKPKRNHLVVMGNEGNGVSKQILDICQSVYISMPGQAESLNVAVATGVILFGWLK